MKCQSLFWEKIRKISSICCLLNLPIVSGLSETDFNQKQEGYNNYISKDAFNFITVVMLQGTSLYLIDTCHFFFFFFFFLGGTTFVTRMLSCTKRPFYTTRGIVKEAYLVIILG